MELLNIIFDIRLASVIIGILLPLYLYWYSTKNHDYWLKRGIPYVKALPFLGSIDFKKILEDIELERYNKFGRIYGYFEGNKPVISVAEPELVKNILVKDFQYFITRRVFNSGDPVVDNFLSLLKGEDWKRVRTIVSPTFTTGKIKRITSIFEDCAKTLVNNFKASTEKDDTTDVTKFYGAFTMDVIASSAFSTKLDSHNDPENEFVKAAKKAFSFKLSLRFILQIMMPKVIRFLGLNARNTKNTVGFFKDVSLEIIKRRRETGETRNDFLQLLLDSAKEVSNEEILKEKSEDIVANYGDDSLNHPVFKNSSNKHLSLDEMVAQCVIFFLAGYHTTATTLSLITYQLALNEAVQEKVFEEMKTCLEETDGKLTYDTVQKMKYLDNVISETLRCHSSVIWLERTADADYKLGDTGRFIPKGMMVHIPIYAMHRDPEFFPQPEIFNPDRFNQDDKSKQMPYSYLPFGAGPRNCVGMRFALMELKVCLVYVLSTFKAQKCSKTKIPVEFDRGTGLVQPKSIELIMVPRSDNPMKSLL